MHAADLLPAGDRRQRHALRGAVARIVFAAAGYLGDVAPYVAPANRLAERGHHVTFLAPAGFHDLLGAERFELAEYPFDFSARAMHADPTHERLMRHPIRNQVRLARYWMRAAGGAAPDDVRASLVAAFRGADAMVTHPTFGSVTVPVAQHLDIPSVVGQLFPMMIPTASWSPPLVSRSRRLGHTANRLAWDGLALSSGMSLYDREVNRLRRAVGQAPQRGNALRGWTTATSRVVLASRHYFGPAPPDWDGGPLVGFSSWAGPAGSPARPDLEEFLAAGPAPVLVCLGTSAASGAGETFAAVARALDGLGLRSLLLVGNDDNLGPVRHRPGAFEFVPVADVLPRCRAAVVAGGLGTMAAALGAGRPLVVLPQLFDQLWHGARVEALGVGRMARRKRDVAAAMASIEADPGYRSRAEALAAQMAAEDGAGALVDAVLAVL